MSRVVAINATRAEVIAMCDRYNMPISATERIHPAGMRVVLHNGHDASILAGAYAGRLLTGTVTRTPIGAR